MIDDGVVTSILLAFLDGATFANALRQNGKPCRISLPDDHESRADLVRAHLNGTPRSLVFRAEGCESWTERVEAVVLATFCPAQDSRCRWLGVDLDAADHGPGGLADPVHAVRVIAERADAAGLSNGLLVARSRRGQGRHVFVLLREPAPLEDAVIGVAALAAAAFNAAQRDTKEEEAPHAFRCRNGAIAQPGDAGAVELTPYSTRAPQFGWAMLLPAAGAFAAHGGGVIVDSFEDRPVQQSAVPRCDPEAWSVFVTEAQASLPERSAAAPPRRMQHFCTLGYGPRDPLDRIDERTREFLEGRTQEGARNRSAFAASANLLGCGVDEREAERLVLAGATACGLPEREARATFRSAVTSVGRRGGCR